jgi:UDP-N-acetylglucosamine--N-acetylmuramyl-(pentapeptide) pyrophosphoryl-undecaprenol N-acetylglucosamine transferase
MDFVYASADIIISEQSVISVGIKYCRCRSFYSFSNVAEDHQTKNAKAIVDKKGALY